MRVHDGYLPDPLDLFLDRDARGENDTDEYREPRPICEYCNEYCYGDIAFEIEPHIWMCVSCLSKAQRDISNTKKIDFLTMKRSN